MEILKLIGNITTSDFPARITDPITSITNVNNLNTRLDSGGILILENATLYIGETNPNQDSYFSLGVSKLKLINSKIFTRGNTLEIFCKEIESDNSSLITAFENLSVPNGTDGNIQIPNGTSGVDGDNGGVIRINLTDKIVGNITIKVDGQNGGRGGNGSEGKNGVNGAPGRDARNGDFGTCRRGPGSGGDGTNGQNGGNAGNGGNGGNGGILIVNYIEKDPQTNLTINFISKAGKGGLAGKLGKGGKGGKGGPRGGQAGNCSTGGIAGRDGVDGKDGLSGVDGTTGQDGKSIVQRMNLNQMEFMTT